MKVFIQISLVLCLLSTLEANPATNVELQESVSKNSLSDLVYILSQYFMIAVMAIKNLSALNIPDWLQNLANDYNHVLKEQAALIVAYITKELVPLINDIAAQIHNGKLSIEILKDFFQLVVKILLGTGGMFVIFYGTAFEFVVMFVKAVLQEIFHL